MRRSPWTTFLGCLVSLAVLATAVPGPGAWVSVLVGAHVDGATDSAAETALLVAAGAIVWTLLGWGVLVAGVAVVGRLPGAPGHVGRAVLRRIAPAAAGRLVAATLGVSLLAGTTACAAPALAGSDLATESTARVSSSAAASAPDPTTSGSAQAVPSIDIDWPLSVPPAATPAPSVVATPTATEVASTVPTSGSAQPGPQSTDVAAPTSSTAPATGTSVDPPPAPTLSEEPDPLADTGPANNSPAVTVPVSPTNPDGATSDAANAAPDLPDRPSTVGGAAGGPAGSGPDRVAGDSGSAAAVSTGPVTVRSGDSLWSIAATTLPPSAAASEIDSAWRAWYLTNRQLIGDDPDLIEPGQILLPPTTDLEPSP